VLGLNLMIADAAIRATHSDFDFSPTLVLFWEREHPDWPGRLHPLERHGGYSRTHLMYYRWIDRVTAAGIGMNKSSENTR
jgi:hypothetical protein